MHFCVLPIIQLVSKCLHTSGHNESYMIICVVCREQGILSIVFTSIAVRHRMLLLQVRRLHDDGIVLVAPLAACWAGVHTVTIRLCSASTSRTYKRRNNTSCRYRRHISCISYLQNTCEYEWKCDWITAELRVAGSAICDMPAAHTLAQLCTNNWYKETKTGRPSCRDV